MKMMKEVEQMNEAGITEDATLLLVKGVGANSSKEENASYVKGLSIAIMTVFQKYEVVKLRCIGKGAIGNAVYAHAQANIELAKQGLVLVAMPMYKTVALEGVGDRTAIVLELTAIEEDVDENGNK
jgi:stage V sporulation protein SpoVS